MTKIITLVFAVAALTACGKKAQDKGTTGSATAAMTGSGSGAGSGSAVAMGSGAGSGSAAVDVPTEQDFEDQASTDITDKNVEAKVKELESDLAPQ